MSDDSRTSKDIGHRHRRTITVSTIASVLAICGLIIPVVGVILTPAIISYLSEAMAGEIREQVAEQVTPVNAGLKALIENNIAELEDAISALEFEMKSGDEWTLMDAQVLTTARRRLRAQQEALQAIVEAELTRKK